MNFLTCLIYLIKSRNESYPPVYTFGPNASDFQGSILSFLFLISINDLLDDINFQLAIYAADNSIYSYRGSKSVRFD